MRAAAFSALLALVPFALALPQDTIVGGIPARNRDPSFPACDTPDFADDVYSDWFSGDGNAWQDSDDPNFYVAPGYGACNFNYTDVTAGVCLKPGWVSSAYHNSCNRLVEVRLPETGISTFARVVDACGALETTTFGCNDIYVTKSVFETLSGNNASALAAGRLPGQAEWRFVDPADDASITINIEATLGFTIGPPKRDLNQHQVRRQMQHA